MADLNIMPLYTDAYLADTTHLSREDHGSYLLILMAMWRAGGSLENDIELLCRIAKVGRKTWPSVWKTIGNFFVIDGNKITQKRLSREYVKASDRKEVSASNGRHGGRPKHLKSNGSKNLAGFETETQNEPRDKAKHNLQESSPYSVLRTPLSKQTNERDHSRSELERKVEALIKAAGGNVVSGASGIENIASILDLEAMGCDFERDICPAVSSTVPRLPEPLRTWGARFIRDAVLANQARRLRGRGDRAASLAEIDWDHWLKLYRETGANWPDSIGPSPDLAGCRAPRDALARHGYAKGNAA